MTHPALHPLIDRLHAQGKLRVWSLIVTILGDIAVPHGNRISGAELLSITDPLGIDERAVRTAISRLRKDGWIDSKRVGRASTYSAVKARLDDTIAAGLRIYAAGSLAEGSQWSLITLPEMRASEREEQIGAMGPGPVWEVAPGVILSPAKPSGTTDCLVLSGDLDHVPDWVRQRICPAEAQERFADHLNTYATLLPELNSLPDMDCLLLRTLLIHDWRKLVLRYPQVPKALQVAGWDEPKARATTAQMYRAILDRSEAVFETDLQDRAVLFSRFNPNT